MKKAALYLRVSTTDQNYDRQEIELNAFAKALGYDVKFVFEEKKSAVLRMDTREELSKMRKLTKADVDCIFIWDITRLSRRAIDFITLVNEFADKGISIHFKDKNIITLDEDGKINAITSMYLYMLGAFAQMDAENLKAKMLSGKKAALLKGNSYTNIAPFGYYLEKKQIYVFEDEAKFVRMAFDLYSKGKDTQFIADIFNATNVPLKSKAKDKVWVKGTIAQISVNTVYYGKGKREEIIKKATKDEAAVKNISYYDAPAIISEELYNACRKRASENSSKQDKSRTIVNLLRGLLVCGQCNKFYVLGNNNKQREYRDGDLRANVNNRLYCKNGSIKAEIADYLVWEAIKNVYAYNSYREKCVEEKEKYKETIASNEDIIQNLNNTLRNLELQTSKLNAAYLKGLFDDSEFENEKQRLVSERTSLENRINEIKAENSYLQNEIDSDTDFSTMINMDLSKEEKKHICNEMIEVIKMYSYKPNIKLLSVKLKVGKIGRAHV